MVQQAQQQISIKGIREGLLVTFGERPSFDEMREQLQAELTAKEAFLQGSRVALAVGKRPLRKSQLMQLQATLLQHQLELWAVLTDQPDTRAAAQDLALATRLSGSQTDLDGNVLQQADATAASEPAAATSQPDGLILKETIRSGRSIYHEGDVVVLGDVNPGAEIIAAGNVIVWGRLRGLVHAGALGDETAVICALELNPTQLRIADQIAISPEERSAKPAPEQVAIRDGQIVAQSWQK